MICPVCNALSLLEVSCPQCGSAAEDEGRWSDWSGPYSPYEPTLFNTVEESALILNDSVCQHAVRCTACHLPFTVEVTAWHV
ncbi:hypothetical protein [Cohnella silvisoli]|uniref:Uncharacterized protein n=1 Tax=Cohnella silvisoli TaxID=2873699 RepID=A0ABV1KWU3_9BACL|nr:hypothetical protein [Cohnella silvisoli]MCD9023953.1 hypothetical protein [Cohnella silvisoli]